MWANKNYELENAASRRTLTLTREARRGEARGGRRATILSSCGRRVGGGHGVHHRSKLASKALVPISRPKVFIRVSGE